MRERQWFWLGAALLAAIALVLALTAFILFRTEPKTDFRDAVYVSRAEVSAHE